MQCNNKNIHGSIFYLVPVAGMSQDTSSTALNVEWGLSTRHATMTDENTDFLVKGIYVQH